MIAHRQLEMSSPELDAETALWASLKTSERERARARLFELHAPFARQIARRRFGLRTGADIEYPDLCQLAYVGLLEAIDRFDPGRGPPFQAFAARRIQGSILDGLSTMNELRQQSSFRRRISAERLRSLQGGSPSPPANLGEALRLIEGLAIGLALGVMLEGSGLYQDGEGQDPAPNPYESLAWSDMARRLRDAMADLPERERLVVRSHYLEDMDFSQIALILGVGKARVSQIHKAALGSLRTALAPVSAFEIRR